MPVLSKSLTLRVASVASWARQIDAICASNPSIGVPAVNDGGVLKCRRRVEGQHLRCEGGEHLLGNGFELGLSPATGQPRDPVHDLARVVDVV
jgi:hypothetical protein